MAYASNESGKFEIYVRPFPEVNKGKWPVSTDGGDSPLWSPDGREMFYRSGDSFMAVEVETEPTFRPAKPKVLFKRTYFSVGAAITHAIWDISPDGKRFLMIKEIGSAASGLRRISVVLNWTEELKQRAPAK
jgi:hypothetical protein